MTLEGLSDEILHSVLRRSCKNLTSLDLSSCPQFLTDFGIDLIGQSLRVAIFFELIVQWNLSNIRTEGSVLISEVS